jgi:hypothetical protein
LAIKQEFLMVKTNQQALIFALLLWGVAPAGADNIQRSSTCRWRGHRPSQAEIVPSLIVINARAQLQGGQLTPMAWHRIRLFSRTAVAGGGHSPRPTFGGMVEEQHSDELARIREHHDLGFQQDGVECRDALWC